MHRDEGVSAWFDEVVNTRRPLWEGSRVLRVSRSLVIEADDDMGTTRVGGRPRPGKEVRRTLMVFEAGGAIFQFRKGNVVSRHKDRCAARTR